MEADEESPQRRVRDARPPEEDPVVLRQLLREVSGEARREPVGHVGLDGEDVEAEQHHAEDVTHARRHGFEREVRDARG